jgi:hypothetical protein
VREDVRRARPAHRTQAEGSRKIIPADQHPSVIFNLGFFRSRKIRLTSRPRRSSRVDPNRGPRRGCGRLALGTILPRPPRRYKGLYGTLSPILESVLPDFQSRSFASDGDLVTNDWKENPNGEGYASRIRSEGRSDVLDWARDFLAPRVEAVHAEFARRYGWDAGTGTDANPAIRGFRYDFETRQFVNLEGQAVPRDAFAGAAERAIGRGAPAGSTTLERAVITRSFLREVDGGGLGENGLQLLASLPDRLKGIQYSRPIRYQGNRFTIAERTRREQISNKLLNEMSRVRDVQQQIAQQGGAFSRDLDVDNRRQQGRAAGQPALPGGTQPAGGGGSAFGLSWRLFGASSTGQHAVAREAGRGRP